MRTGSGGRAKLPRVLREAYWRADSAELVVTAWERSGETLSVFARRHGLGRGRLARWRDRLRKRRVPAGLRFHPVRVRDTDRSGTDPAMGIGRELELVLRSGRRIVVRGGFEAEVLVELVRLLESGRC